jgi:hypothetical protein
MKQADSSRPVSASVTHLFRHLDDPDALRSNPIVAHLFECTLGGSPAKSDADVLAGLRARVTRAAESFRRTDLDAHHDRRAHRHHAIITRCDLGRESHDVVARDLGICARHFYRERRSAQHRIAKLLAADRRAQPTAVVSREEASFAHASMLAELGCSARAFAELHAIASEAASPEGKIRALATLARMFSNFGKLDEAQDAIGIAIREIGPTDAKGDRITDRLWILLAQYEIYGEQGDFTRAHAALEALTAMLPASMAVELGGSASSAVHALCVLAWRAYWRGSASGACDKAGSALHLLAGSWQPPPLLRENLMHVQTLSLHQLGRITTDEARTRLTELLQSARSAGSLEQSAGLFCSLATLLQSDLKRTYRAEAHRLARQHGSVYLQRQIHLAAAASALVHPDPEQADGSLRKSRRFGTGDESQYLLAEDIQARLALLRGDVDRAMTYASDAHALAVRLGHDRARGAIMRTLASVQLERRHLRDASTLIDEAISVIERHGNPSSLMLALAVRSQIPLRV